MATVAWPRRSLMTLTGTLGPKMLDLSAERAPTTRVRPLPVAAVHDVLERAPVGPLDRRERTVGGDAERNQQGAEPVLGNTQQAPREFLGVDAGMGAADAEI